MTIILRFKILLTLILSAFCLFTSCTSVHEEELNILPLSLNGTVECGGESYTAVIYFDAPSRGRLTLNTASTDTAVSYETDGSAVSLTLGGLTLPIAVVPPMLEFCKILSELDAPNIVSTESDGSRITAVYDHTGRTVKVVFENGRIQKAECGGIVFTAE